jgi:hypothetical protein
VDTRNACDAFREFSRVFKGYTVSRTDPSLALLHLLMRTSRAGGTKHHSEFDLDPVFSFKNACWPDAHIL